MASLSKRMVIRLADDLDAWIGEQAAREGLDNATWTRAVLTRLKNGMPPIIGAAPAQPLMTVTDQPQAQYSTDPTHRSDAAAILEARLAEAADAASSGFIQSPPAAADLGHELIGAAYPLRRVERSRYNPGRSGYG